MQRGAAGQIVTIRLGPGEHRVNGSVVTFDHRTVASDVTLEGEPNATLRPLIGTDLLVEMHEGAPSVHIHGIVLRGRLLVLGGVLEVMGCKLLGSPASHRRRPTADQERPISVQGGVVKVRDSQISGHRSGAMFVSAGSVDLTSCVLSHNSDTRGGAAL